MWYSTGDIITLVIGGIVLLASLVAFPALLIPSLGKRIYGVRWPGAIADRVERRKRYLRLIAPTGVMFCLSLLALVKQLSYTVCVPQNTMRNGQIAVLLILVVILILVLQTKSGAKAPQHINQPISNLSRKTTILVLLMGIIGSLLFFFVFAPHILPPYTPDSDLDRVVMVSETEGWAIGNFMALGVLYHYDHGVWRELEPPYIGNLHDISMPSPDQGWIVGDIMLHYRDRAWVEVPSPVKRLNSIDMLSGDEGWAVGVQGKIVHYTQGRWVEVASPTDKTLVDISMISGSEGWAVGGDYFQVPFGCADGAHSRLLDALLHYQDGMWSKVASPNSKMLRGISMLDADNGLLVGWGAVFHYAQGRWEESEFERLP